MADSTSWLTQMTAAQSGKEATANALWDAMSPAANFGRRVPGTTGLTWAYYGGVIFLDGVRTEKANSTIALTASATNYIEVDRAGIVSKNTTGFTAGKIPLYRVVTGTSTVTSYDDYRPPEGTSVKFPGLKNVSMTSDANKTLTQEEADCRILNVTSTVSLTTTRNIVVPRDSSLWWIVKNGTTGGQAIQVIGSAGTGISIANGMTAIVYANGTNILRATGDI